MFLPGSFSFSNFWYLKLVYSVVWYFVSSLPINVFFRFRSNRFFYIYLNSETLITLHKKWRFPLRISAVNVNESAVSFWFGHIYWRIYTFTSFFVQCQSKQWSSLRIRSIWNWFLCMHNWFYLTTGDLTVFYNFPLFTRVLDSRRIFFSDVWVLNALLGYFKLL